MPNVILKLAYVNKADPSIRFYDEVALKAHIEANLSDRSLAFWDTVYEAFDLDADSTVHIGGTLQYTPTSVLKKTANNEIVIVRNGNGTLGSAETLLRFNGTSDASESLPKCIGRGRAICFKNVSTFKWTLTPTGGDTIDGKSIFILTPSQSITLIDSSATNWDIT
jgi:hypothetical protein